MYSDFSMVFLWRFGYWFQIEVSCFDFAGLRLYSCRLTRVFFKVCIFLGFDYSYDLSAFDDL